MEIEYDKEADAAYIWFSPGLGKDLANEVWLKEFKEHIGLLFSSKGKVFGIEILPASAYLEEELLKRSGKTC